MSINAETIDLLEQILKIAKSVAEPTPPAPTPLPPMQYLSVAEFAERIGTTPATVRSFCKEGMPHIRPRPRLTRVHIAKAEEWLRDRASSVTVAEAARLGRAAARRDKGR